MAATIYLIVLPPMLPFLKEGGQHCLFSGHHWSTAHTEGLLLPAMVTVVPNQMIFCFVFFSLT